MKIQTKISLLFTLLTGSVIFLLSILVYVLATRFSVQDLYRHLDIRAVIAARSTLDKDVSNADLLRQIREDHLEPLPSEEDYFIKLNPDKTFRQPEDVSLPEHYYREVIRNGKATFRRHDRLYAGLLYQAHDGHYIVIVSAKSHYISGQQANLGRILIVGFSLSMLLIFSVSIFFSGQIFRPVRRITSRVKDISAQNLHMRLDAGSGKDELSELAQTFNNMLDRLETSFETQNNFVSNASHELNTPLTTIIGEAELALGKSRSEAEYKQSLTVILTEAERLKHILVSLLHLAQTGFEGKKLSWQTIRIDEMIWQAKQTVDQIYPQNKVFIDYSLMPEDEEKLRLQGNPQLLELALSNIILNACKYSGNKEVIVALAATNKEIKVIVKDQGIGIPSEEIRYIFDPFFRASNTSSFKGYGIGLPLSRNIIRIHDGDIHVYSREGAGTEVRLTFPISEL